MKKKEILFETDYWSVMLSEDQAYLGRCRVVLKRASSSLSNLEPQEWADLHEQVIKKLEPSFKKAFGAKMFNWTCLMNDAYKPGTPEPHVHFHFRPRYSKTVTFVGETFLDPEFSYHYDRARRKIVSQEVLEKISQEVKKYL